jgi:hypothetical protein
VNDPLKYALIALALLVAWASIFPVIKVLGRLGLCRAWALLFCLGPVGWVAGMYVLAYRKWPALDRPKP